MKKSFLLFVTLLATFLTFSPQKTWAQVNEYFSIKSNYSLTVNFTGSPNVDLWYSTNKSSWTKITETTNFTLSGNTYYFKGNNPSGFSKDADNYVSFLCTSTNQNYTVAGNVMSLVNANDFQTNYSTIPNDYCFYCLFTNITDAYANNKYISGYLYARNLSLPANNLKRYCYAYMFHRTYLKECMTILPAQNLAEYCYYKMFYNTPSLDIPEAYKLILAAEELAPHCYEYMFGIYNSQPTLTQYIEIMATSLKDSQGNDVENAMTRMFSHTVNGDKNLTWRITLHFSDWGNTSVSTCPTYYWFDGQKNYGRNYFTVPATLTDRTKSTLSGQTVSGDRNHFPYSAYFTDATDTYLTFNVKVNGGSWESGSEYNEDKLRVVRAGYPAKSVPADPVKLGCKFLGWYTAPSGGTEVETSTILSQTTAQTYYAQFAALDINYDVTIKSCEHGHLVVTRTDVSPTVEYTTNANLQILSNLTVTAVPDAGYRFAAWTDDVLTLGTSFLLLDNATLGATFEPDEFTITINTPAANGTITASDGVTNYASGQTYTFNRQTDFGKTLTFTATPSSHRLFTGFTGQTLSNVTPATPYGNSDYDKNGTGTYTITGNEANELTVGAAFAVPQFTITTTAKSGSVTLSADDYDDKNGSGTYPIDTKVTLTAVADPYFNFVQWSDGETESKREITLLKDTILTAVFKLSSDIHSSPAMVDVYQAGTNAGYQILYSLEPVTGDDGITYRPVDVGAGVAFANKNLGAADSTSFGSYFYWGGTTPVTTAASGTYYTGVATETDLPVEADAAYQIMGERWRLPNNTEVSNLCNTSYVVKTAGGNGAYFIANKAFPEQKIYIPGAGRYTGTSLTLGYSYFWSSKKYSGTSATSKIYHYYNGSLQGNTSTSAAYAYAYYAEPVRAVYVPPFEVCTLTVKIGSYTWYYMCEKGQQVTITAHETPSTNSSRNVLTDWKDGSSNVVTTNPSFTIIVTGDATYTATFASKAASFYKVITGNVTPAASGIVNGTGSYLTGSEVMLTAVPNKAFRFVRWSDGNTDNPRTITASDNLTYTAEFVAEGVTSPTANLDVFKTGVRAGYYKIAYDLPTDANGYRAVDMGNGIAWANKNLGAADSTKAGNYYYWGGTSPVTSVATTAYYGDEIKYFPLTTGYTTGTHPQFPLPADRDAATVNMGNCWRMPTYAELYYLVQGSGTKVGATATGWMYSNKYDADQRIYIPAGGYYKSGSTLTAGTYFWGSTLNSTTYATPCNSSPICYVNNATQYSSSYYCYTAMPVRAVYQPPFETCTLTVNVYEGTSLKFNYYFICEVGQTIRLTAHTDPNSTYAFQKWADPSNATVILSSDAEYEITISKNTTYGAYFVNTTSNYATITTSSQPRNAGAVRGAGRYVLNTTTQLNAEAVKGYHFLYWEDDHSNTNPYREITVSANASYEAVFESDYSEASVISEHKYLSVFQDGRGAGTSIQYLLSESNGYRPVDMGDGVAWANKNLGATDSTETGSFFYFGGTDAVTKAANTDYYTDITSMPLTTDKTYAQFGLPAAKDAATVNMGSHWRMPNLNEIYYLANPTGSTETGSASAGYTYVNKITGEQIFIPSAGYYKTTSRATGVTVFWGSTVGATNATAYNYQPSCYVSGTSYANSTNYYCWYALPIRAVYQPDFKTCVLTVVSGSGTYKYVCERGQKITLRAYATTANNGFLNWKDADGNIISTNPTQEVVMTTDQTLTATYGTTFTSKCVVNITSRVTNSTSAANPAIYKGTGAYERGATTTLIAEVQPNYNFLYWEDDHSLTDPVRVITVDQAEQNYTAVYEMDVPTPASEHAYVNIYQPGTNKGTFTLHTDVPTNPTCTLTFKMSTSSSAHTYVYVCELGQKVTVSCFYIAPPTNLTTTSGSYTVAAWTDANGIVVSNDATCEFIALCDQTYTLTYKSSFTTKRTISFASRIDNSDLPATPGLFEGAGVYENGQVAKIIAHPFAGYEFMYWDDDHTKTDTARIITVDADRQYVAVYRMAKDLGTVVSAKTYANIYQNGTTAIGTFVKYALPGADANGYRPVDVGTGIAWANKNIGAADSTEAGNFYYWGGTIPMTEKAATSNYYTGVTSMTTSAYNGVQTPLPADADVATQVMGSNWRMATVAEIYALQAATGSTETGSAAAGYTYVSKENDKNVIFIPATGFYNTSGFNNATLNTIFWGSTAGTISSYNTRPAYYNNGSYSAGSTTYYSYYGLPVRAVYQPSFETCTITVNSNYKYVCEVGQKIVLSAYPTTPTSNHAATWTDAYGNVLSTDATIEMLALKDETLTVAFNTTFTTKRTVTTAVSPANCGTVTGGGVYSDGQTTKIFATPVKYYKFLKWQEDDKTEDFRIEKIVGNPTYTAVFVPDPTQVEAGSKTVDIYHEGESENQILFTEFNATAADGLTYNPVVIGNQIWADRNIGASAPDEVGGYFYYGGTAARTSFSTSYYYNTYSNMTSGSNLSATYDAAAQVMGNGWRMPTNAEWTTLISNTTREGTTLTDKTNANNVLTLPAGGMYNTSLTNNGVNQCYWSSTIQNIGSSSYKYRGQPYVYVNGAMTYGTAYYTYFGMPIRAILGGEYPTRVLTIHAGDHDYQFFCQQHQAVTVNVNANKDGYIFEQWSDGNADIERTFVVSEDIEVTASFVQGSSNSFRITFKNADGETLGAPQFIDRDVVPAYTGETPTMESSAEFDFSFREWSPALYAADKDQTYTAVYDSIRRSYNITFVNYDNSELQVVSVPFGTVPAYTQDTPLKESTVSTVYTFDGWGEALVAVTGEHTYTAHFAESVRQYIIIFADEDGTELQRDTINYNTTTKWAGATAPTKEDAQFYYSFARWEYDNGAFIWYTNTPKATKDAVYTAYYDKTLRSYTVTFLNYDGSQLKSSTLDYGEQPICDTPIKPETPHSDFIFDGWLSSQDSQVYTTIPTVTGQVTYTAQFHEQEVATYTITFLDEDGTLLDKQNLKEGRMPQYGGAPLVKSGYEFVGWDVAIVPVSGNATYRATYLPAYTITANTAGKTNVRLTAEGYDDQINTGVYKTGTVVTMTVLPSLDYSFSQWSDGNTDNPRTITLTENKTFTAEFAPLSNLNLNFDEGILEGLNYYLSSFAIKAANDVCEVRLFFAGKTIGSGNYSSYVSTDINNSYIRAVGGEKKQISSVTANVSYFGDALRAAKVVAAITTTDSKTYNVTIYTNEEENYATFEEDTYNSRPIEGSWQWGMDLKLANNPHNVLNGFSASSAYMYRESDHLIKWYTSLQGSSRYENFHVQLQIFPIEGKPGIIPSGVYPINSTGKPGTVYIGALPTGSKPYLTYEQNSYNSGCGSFFHYEIESDTIKDPNYIDYKYLHRFDYVLRSGYVEVINSNENYVIHVHAYADAHHSTGKGVVDFYINGTGIDSDNPADFMPANITIAAKTTTDTPLTDAVTATVGASTTPIAQGVHSQFLGDELHLVADKDHYVFSHWLVNGVQVSTSPTYDYTVNGSNAEIVAVFAPDTRNYYTISTTLTGGTGSVNLVSGLKNYTTSGLFPEGSEVTLTVTPDLHVKFIRWEDGDEHNPRTIIVSGNKTYTAVLAEDIVTKDIYQDGTYSGGINIGYHLDPVTVDGITYTPIDMGNGLALADRNIGAATPQDAGRYFYWGDIVGQDPAEGTPTFSTANYYTDIKNMTQYSSVLPLDYDAAHVILGDNWRMPTLYDISHLYNYQYSLPYYDSFNQWTITGQYHNYGITPTGSQSTGFTYTYNNDPAHSIFVPAVYYYRPTKSSSQSTNFWISTCGKPSSNSNAYDCNGSYFSGSNWGGQTCYYGMPIRPMYAPNVGTTCTLTIKVKGTSYTYQYTCQPGQKITINPNAMTGYSFDKWLQSDGSTPVSDPLVVNSNTFVVNGNATYYASFKDNAKNYYMITFLDEAGNTLTKMEVEEGVTPSYDYVKRGYIFKEWSPALYAADKNETYTAIVEKEPEYFTLTNTGNTNATLYLKRAGGNNSNTLNIEWSINYGAWVDNRESNYDNSTSIIVPAGKEIRFRGNNVKNGVYQFNSAGSLTQNIYWYMYSQESSFKASGDIMSLVAFDPTSQTIKVEYPMANGCFYQLFNYYSGSTPFTTLTDASELKLPSNPSNYCFAKMFDGCAALTSAPALSATTLGSYSYAYMFAGCQALVNAPELSATTLGSYCYYGMFSGCTGLTTAPDLGVTTLQEGCYAYMFQNCSTLVNVQDTLPGTNLPKLCYQYMFDGCVALETAPEIMAAENATVGQACMDNMFANCSTLTKAPSVLRPATLSGNSCVAHMFYNCTKLTKAPTIMATDITGGNAADWMFGNCGKLNYMRIYRTSFPTSITNSNYWVTGVSETGTIYCPPTLQRLWTQTYSKMPYSSSYPWIIYSYDITFVPVEGTWADGSSDSKHFTWETDVEEIDKFINVQVDAQSQSIIKGYYLDAAMTQATDLNAIRADLPVQQTTTTKYIYVTLKPVATQEYQISFVDEDGTTILEKDTVAAGTTPTYKGETPTKTKTAQYTYTFAGWTPALYAADKDQTYTATFTPTTRTYMIKFLDENGNTLQTGMVPYGTTPSCNLPTKENTDEYTYSYAWDKTIVPVTGSATYWAVLTETKNKYTIRFMNGDTELQNTEVEYGETPAYDGTPAKASTEQYEYVFTGWNDGTTDYSKDVTLPSVTGTATYTATFSEMPIRYTITIDPTTNGSIMVMNGETPVASGDKVARGTTLTITATPDEGYTFGAWTTGDGYVTPNAQGQVSINADTRLGATFVQNAVKYTIRLGIDESIINGTISLTYNNTTYTEQKEYEIPEGTEVTLTLSPGESGNPSYPYDGGEFWDADGYEVLYEGLTWTFTMTQDMSVFGMCYIKKFVMPDTYASADEYAALPWNLLIRRLVLSRSFKAKTWSTMCLPFGCSLQGYEMEGMIYTLQNATYDAVTNKITVDFGTVDEMEAGTPYMLYSKTAGSNPVFDYVTLNEEAVAGKTTINGVSYAGVMGTSTMLLKAGDKNVRYISSNKLYIPSSNGSGVNIVHDRAYFTLPNYQGIAPRLSIRINGETLEEAEDETMTETGVDKYINNGILYIRLNGTTYNAQGQKID